ncbi:hypothetical protein GCM10007981_01080 [Thermocladium modestius]|uniref:Uncharacterized protein n=1 Tax=Thermocladium modestius TaxID=62609 RepID=A0A830GTF9_9CREN|nr:hypothetical protein [Thermocladium modestius]GGP19033.1 hypothetical protein GCM10007981_01080 [Thermocladium modestius]
MGMASAVFTATIKKRRFLYLSGLFAVAEMLTLLYDSSLASTYGGTAIISLASALFAYNLYFSSIFLSDAVSEELGSEGRFIFLRSVFRNARRYVWIKAWLSIAVAFALIGISSVIFITALSLRLGLAAGLSTALPLFLAMALAMQVQIIGVGSLFRNSKIAIAFTFIFYAVVYNGVLIYALSVGRAYPFMDLAYALTVSLSNAMKLGIASLSAGTKGGLPIIQFSSADLALSIAANLLVGIMALAVRARGMADA